MTDALARTLYPSAVARRALPTLEPVVMLGALRGYLTSLECDISATDDNDERHELAAEAMAVECRILELEADR